MDMNKGRRVRRIFNKDFKVQAVRLIIEEGKKVADVAQDLDIDYAILCRWKKEHLEAIQKINVNDLLHLQRELDDTRKQLATVQKECDKYRKALTVLLTIGEAA